MFRIIWPGALPGDRFQRLFHPSIDRLLELMKSESNGNHANLTARSDEFSAIMRHVRIGRFWKRTQRNRLIEADRVLSAQLKKNYHRKINFLDVGASDGVTTLDTVNYLYLTMGLNVNAFVADQYLFLLRLQRGSMIEYVTTDGLPVLVRLGPIGLLLGPTEGLEGFLLRPEIFITKWIVAGYLNLTSFRSNMRITDRIPLVNPSVLNAGNINLLEMDIFEIKPEMTESMDIIRSSNVITKEYFPQSKIEQAIKIFYTYLRPGGYLLLSRNLQSLNGEVECGSLWEKTRFSFSHVADLTFESEVKDVVDRFRPVK